MGDKALMGKASKAQVHTCVLKHMQVCTGHAQGTQTPSRDSQVTKHMQLIPGMHADDI